MKVFAALLTSLLILVPVLGAMGCCGGSEKGEFALNVSVSNVCLLVDSDAYQVSVSLENLGNSSVLQLSAYVTAKGVEERIQLAEELLPGESLSQSILFDKPGLENEFGLDGSIPVTFYAEDCAGKGYTLDLTLPPISTVPDCAQAPAALPGLGARGEVGHVLAGGDAVGDGVGPTFDVLVADRNGRLPVWCVWPKQAGVVHPASRLPFQ